MKNAEDGTLHKNMKALQQNIKRAKLFAIQHLTRRIKMLRNKRGTEQQIEKNTRKANRLEQELEYIKELDINVVVKRIQKRDLSISTMENEERALNRLISSKPIQDHLRSVDDKAQKKSVVILKATPKSPVVAECSNTSTLAFCSRREDDSVTSESAEIELERTVSSFFVDNLSNMKNSDQKCTRIQNRKPERQKEKNDVVNRISRKNVKKSQKGHKKSSNRMGQRARQRLWKEQFGKNAKHVKCGDKMTKPKQKPDNILSTKRQRPRRQEKTKEDAKRKVEEQVASHPSWEASRRRKLQQNISQTTFQGQKITFDD